METLLLELPGHCICPAKLVALVKQRVCPGMSCEEQSFVDLLSKLACKQHKLCKRMLLSTNAPAVSMIAMPETPGAVAGAALVDVLLTTHCVLTDLLHCYNDSEAYVQLGAVSNLCGTTALVCMSNVTFLWYYCNLLEFYCTQPPPIQTTHEVSAKAS